MRAETAASNFAYAMAIRDQVVVKGRVEYIPSEVPEALDRCPQQANDGFLDRQ
jgi:hypothetical protein